MFLQSFLTSSRSLRLQILSCFSSKNAKLNICHHMLKSSTQLQNRSFHVIERTRTSSKCQKMKNARAKRAKILFFIVKYANLWGFCCRRRRGCLSCLLTRLISKFHVFTSPLTWHHNFSRNLNFIYKRLLAVESIVNLRKECSDYSS